MARYFRISSSLKDIIGRDLITNDFVAVFELVKNSFDAHARRVDSPNTEASLRRSIERKKTVTRGHIEKAARQLRGSISHFLGRDRVMLQTTSGPGFINIDNRSVFGLIVVREMFDDDFKPCSAPVLAVAQETGQPCVLVDYAAFHAMSLYLPSQKRFVSGLLQLFEAAQKYGEFPKPRFTGKPVGRGTET